jgi:hypothetical protein
MGIALNAAKAYERGELGRIAPALRPCVGGAYLDAVRYADSMVTAVTV